VVLSGGVVGSEEVRLPDERKPLEDGEGFWKKEKNYGERESEIRPRLLNPLYLPLAKIQGERDCQHNSPPKNPEAHRRKGPRTKVQRWEESDREALYIK